MKNIIFVALAIMCGCYSVAQNISPEFDYRPGRNAVPVHYGREHNFWSKACVDLNLMRGMMTDKVNGADPSASYPDALNTKISGLKYNKGNTTGIDAELGYYFDRAGRYGLGLGLMYLQQYGSLTLDNFHIEYKSTDGFGNTFRQVLTSNGQIKESLRTSDFSIPVLFKYKKRFSSLVGFTADAGLLVNFSERTHYSSNASFDYEAIYDYTGTQGSIVPVYDYAANPQAGDLLLTKAQYLSNHTATQINQYFNTLQSEGYNVGLGVKPASNSGRVSYMAAHVGLLLRPAISIFCAEQVTVNVGVYYLYQDFSHNTSASYRITDKLGQYNSLTGSISGSANNGYGFSVGATYRFRKLHPPVFAPAMDTSSVPEEDLSPEAKDNSSYVAPGSNGSNGLLSLPRIIDGLEATGNNADGEELWGCLDKNIIWS